MTDSGMTDSGRTESGTGARIVPVNDLPARRTLTRDLPVPASALAIGAHPDDIEFGCGATLAKWAAAGTVLHHLVLTDGSKGSWDPALDESALSASRKEEQRRAATILGGGHVTFLERTDGELGNDTSTRWAVSQLLRLVRPDVVLTHDPWRRYRLHPDHRAAGFIVTDSIVAARDPHFFADQDLMAHRPSTLLLWEADEANHVEDVTDFVETKIAALLAHESQFQSTMGIEGGSANEFEAFTAQIREQLRQHGGIADLPYGESFHLMTDL
jgi:LmbE family N-acetylglucosaminyl deacetylase